MRRPLEHLVHVADLDDPAEIHHRDPVGDVAHHRQIVRDEQVRQAELGLQPLEQVDDAGANRHVERRHGLVEHEQLRLERQRARDADPLPLAAGERLRIAVGVLGLQADERSSSRTRRARSAGGTPCVASGSARMSPIGSRGSSDAIGSWNTTCRSRRIANRSARVMRAVSSAEHDDRARPSGCTRFRISMIVVVLPQPDSPTSPSVSPSRMSKLMPSTACTRADAAAQHRALRQREIP